MNLIMEWPTLLMLLLATMPMATMSQWVSQLEPQSPCPRYFQYTKDNEAWQAVITVPAPALGTTLRLNLKMSIAERLRSKYAGRIEMLGDRSEILQKLLLGLDLRYAVYFPMLNPIPKVTGINFNGQLICSGPPATLSPGEYITGISLDHVLRTQDNTNNANANSPNSPSVINSDNNINLPAQDYFSNGIFPKGEGFQHFPFRKPGSHSYAEEYYYNYPGGLSNHGGYSPVWIPPKGENGGGGGAYSSGSFGGGTNNGASYEKGSIVGGSFGSGSGGGTNNGGTFGGGVNNGASHGSGTNGGGSFGGGSYGGGTINGGSFSSGTNNGGSFGSGTNNGGSFGGGTNNGGSFGGGTNNGGSFGGGTSNGGLFVDGTNGGGSNNGGSFGGGTSNGGTFGSGSNIGGSFGGGANSGGSVGGGSDNRGTFGGLTNSGGSNTGGTNTGGSFGGGASGGGSDDVGDYKAGGSNGNLPMPNKPPIPENKPNTNGTPNSQGTGVMCGKPLKGWGNQLVFGGKDSKRGQWPWLAALYVSKPASFNFICGGTLVSDRHIITAAHCIRQQNNTPVAAESLLVKLGALNLQTWNERDSAFHQVLSYRLHPDYDGILNFHSDIAVVIIERVQFSANVIPACLWDEDPDQNKVVGETGLVVGWGRDDTGLLVTPEPRHLNVPIVSTLDCLRSSQLFYHLTSNHTLCAGKRDGTGPCNGDSGSGMYMKRNDTWRLRALVSASVKDTANNGCDLKQYVVYTDVAMYAEWIREILSELP